MKRADITDPQPPPTRRPGAPSLHDIAAALHADRRDHGRSKYDSLLTTFNGRRAGVDRLQESLDRLVYEIQGVLEEAALRTALGEFRLRMHNLAERGGSVEDVRRAFEDLLNPAALAVRADALGAGLIEGR